MITDEQLKWISLWTEASLFVGRDGETTVTSSDLASDLLSARQTIAEQEKRIKELEQIVNSKTMIIKSLRDQPNYDPDDFRVGKGYK